MGALYPGAATVKRMRGAPRGLLAIGLAGLALAPAARAQGVDTTCELPLTKFDPTVVNVAYPDEAAVYYSGHYQAAPGTRIRITGRYPHARYMSFNVYDNAQRPLDALADVEIGPDPGSVNPFPPNADRTSATRAYTAYIDFGPIPQRRAPNTLYTGTGQGGAPNFEGTFIYRVYVPDKGLDEAGGVGLPTVTLEPASGGGAPDRSSCATFSKPAVPGVNEQVAASNGLPAPERAEFPGENPPAWHKFTNLPTAGADLFFENPYADQGRQALNQIPGGGSLGGSGGFLSNIHNSYLYANINRGYGQVLVTRMRAPKFADTRAAPPRMPSAQLRYFSLCENEPFSQRYVACATDDRSAITRDGYVNYVISTPAQRPGNATSNCGATWLPWGPATQGVLIYRHMLPDPKFAQAIQRVPERGKEQAVMGSYFPVSRYLAERADFERLGCGRALSAGLRAVARCRDRRAPRTTLDRRRSALTRRGIRLVGRSRDQDCVPHTRRVRRVQVAIARMVPGGCRWLAHRGRFARRRTCRRPVFLGARARYVRRARETRFAFSLRRRLPRGRYHVIARGIDPRGVVESKRRRARLGHFRVR
jgi:hypothetical protein